MASPNGRGSLLIVALLVAGVFFLITHANTGHGNAPGHAEASSNPNNDAPLPPETFILQPLSIAPSTRGNANRSERRGSKKAAATVARAAARTSGTSAQTPSGSTTTSSVQDTYSVTATRDTTTTTWPVETPDSRALPRDLAPSAIHCGYSLIWPLPVIRYLVVVNSRRPIGPRGVQLLGADADLGAEAELLAIGEAGRSVDDHGGGVDFALKAQGGVPDRA